MVCQGRHVTHVEVVGIVGVQHATGNVGNVHASVGLSNDIHLVAGQVEGVDEVLPELHELVCDIDLILRSRGALGEARADGLVDIDDIGQAVPPVRVLNGRIGAILPKERAVLLEETLERRATGLEGVSQDHLGRE